MQDQTNKKPMDIKHVMNRIGADGLRAYLMKAFVLVVCLWAVSRLTPMLPMPILLVIFVAYALLATLGALYFTTIKRIHREYQLNKEGRLSQINRKWSFRMALFFLLSLFSAFLFVLESPRWDALEWVFTFLAVPLYFVAYKATEYGLRKEFDKKFLKARAMKASFWLMGTVLCLIYAILATVLFTTDAEGLREAFDQTPRFFENSPSAFMSEADLISSFMQGVTSYLVTQIAGQFFLVGVVYHFAVYAFVFFGMINQFGFCLLNGQEIKGEFQLLPANYESRGEQPILMRYLAILVGMGIVLSGVFLFLDFKAFEARETGEPTKVEILIENWTRELLFRFDDAYEKDKEFRELENRYDETVEEILQQRNAELEPLIQEYYNRCKSNMDAYLDWYEGLEGQSMRALKWLPGDLVVNHVRDKFLEKMRTGNDETPMQDVYRGYQDRLHEVQATYAADMNNVDPDDVRSVMASAEVDEEEARALDFWLPFADDGASASVKDILLNEDNLNREQLKASIVQLIDRAQTDLMGVLQVG